MKRLLAIIIIAVIVLPLFAFSTSAEETSDKIVLFENGKYKVKLVCSEEDANFFLNLLFTHTNMPYDENLVDDQGVVYINSGLFSEEYNNKINYVNNTIAIGYDSPENRERLFTEFKTAVEATPKDRIALDRSLFTIIEDTEEKDEGLLSQIFNNVTDGFESLKKKIDDLDPLSKVFDGAIATVDKATAEITIRKGGFNYVDADSPLNNIISRIYNLLYPIGFITMLLCWGFGVAKSTISTSLDIKDKGSIIHSVISLILGLAAMSLAPQILTLLTGISQWMCNSIFDICLKGDFLKDITIPAGLSILKIFVGGTSQEALFTAIVLLVVDLIFIINILWIALLQCLSPIFIGLMANQATRKISFNFIKEYFKAMLVPVVTIIYFFLASAILKGSFAVGGMVVALVLAISTLGIAGKKLDKLIN